MTPHWVIYLGFFLSWTLVRCQALTFVSRGELFGQIANRQQLESEQLRGLLNVPYMGVYRELVAKDCTAAYLNRRRRSGLYLVWPKNSPPLVVYCDLSPQGGGWTVLQRNTHQNTTSFGSQDWRGYRDGFGDLQGNHWLGNELIYLLTRQNAFMVRFLLVDSLGNEHYADYSSFRVDSEDRGYALRLGDYSGNAGDALSIMNETGTHDNMKFSTADNDNDRWDKNCAEVSGGGWWFDSCRSAFLNSDHSIYWGGLCDESKPCVATSILIKPGRKNCSPIPLPGPGEYYPIHSS
ncbi:fibrinogen-like protein 1-like protein [Mixophyes fleayi]|uniref:fibrinogen-like protein 1-like protein n=1 Tax=Mixophyes fleayi TaxID=3061075 RepID=UPI003F4DB0BA